jgi:hypothetical protein
MGKHSFVRSNPNITRQHEVERATHAITIDRRNSSLSSARNHSENTLSALGKLVSSFLTQIGQLLYICAGSKYISGSREND